MAAEAAFCPIPLVTVVAPEELATRLPELLLVKEMGDDAVFIKLWLELPLAKDVGDEAVFTGLLLKSPLAKDTGDDLVLVMQLRFLCLILLVKEAGAEAVFTGLLLKSPLAKDVGDDLLFMTELELVALTGDELALTKLDGLFDHSFIITPLSFYHLVKSIFATYGYFENIRQRTQHFCNTHSATILWDYLPPHPPFSSQCLPEMPGHSLSHFQRPVGPGKDGFFHTSYPAST